MISVMTTYSRLKEVDNQLCVDCLNVYDVRCMSFRRQVTSDYQAEVGLEWQITTVDRPKLDLCERLLDVCGMNIFWWQSEDILPELKARKKYWRSCIYV